MGSKVLQCIGIKWQSGYGDHINWFIFDRIHGHSCRDRFRVMNCRNEFHLGMGCNDGYLTWMIDRGIVWTYAVEMDTDVHTP